MSRGSLVHRCAVLTALAAGPWATLSTQQPERWVVELSPALTLGLDETEPAALFQVIVFATRLPDGSVIVGDRGEYALRRFDSTGRFVRAFGRKGAGPGEVRYLARMFRCGDLLYTYDIEEGHRMSVFNLDGRYLRAFRWQAPPGQTVPYVSACNAAGDFVHVGWPTPAVTRPGIYRSRVAVWTSRGDSGAPRMMDSVAGSERWGVVTNGRLLSARALPLGKQPVVAIGRSRVFVGSADRFMVRSSDLAGRALTAIERPSTPIAVTKSDIREEIERAVANAGESRRDRVEAAYAEITFPSTLPAYTQLLVDSEDYLWVRPFASGPGSTVRWSVFAPSGAFVGEVAVPKHLEVFEIGPEYVLGRFMDPEEAIPQVRLYRLARPPAPSKH